MDANRAHQQGCSSRDITIRTHGRHEWAVVWNGGRVLFTGSVFACTRWKATLKRLEATTC